MHVWGRLLVVGWVAQADTIAKVGYNSRRSLYIEATLEPTERPYLLFISTFAGGKEAHFQLEVFYEGAPGDITMKEAPRPPKGRKAKGEPY